MSPLMMSGSRPGRRDSNCVFWAGDAQSVKSFDSYILPSLSQHGSDPDVHAILKRMDFPITTRGSVRVTIEDGLRSDQQTALLRAIRYDLVQLGAQRVLASGNAISFAVPIARYATWNPLTAVSKGSVSIESEQQDVIVHYKLVLSPLLIIGSLLAVMAIAILLFQPNAPLFLAVGLAVASYLMVVGCQAMIANSNLRRTILKSAKVSGFYESEAQPGN